MQEDQLQLPTLEEIQEVLQSAKEDIKEEIQENPELASSAGLLNQLMEIIEEKVANKKDLSALDEKSKIDLAAHLHFFQILLEDFFYFEEEFDENGEEFNWDEEDGDEDQPKEEK